MATSKLVLLLAITNNVTNTDSRKTSRISQFQEGRVVAERNAIFLYLPVK